MATYKLIKPEATDVLSVAWKQAKVSWWFWMIIGVIVFSIVSFGFLGLFLFFPFIFYVAAVIGKAEDVYWKQIAENNGWQYKAVAEDLKEQGIMFQQGNSRRTVHLIQGNVDGRKFRMFNYSFTTGQGKEEATHWYTVFAFKFEGTFPHIYLNNKHNSYSVNVGEKLSLPAEFEKQFVLSAPRKYETEALEIFTPDILAKLLDGGFTHDVELVDHELIMFVDGSTDSFKKLEKEFNKVIELEDLFDEKLDKFKFEKIGDIKFTL